MKFIYTISLIITLFYKVNCINNQTLSTVWLEDFDDPNTLFLNWDFRKGCKHFSCSNETLNIIKDGELCIQHGPKTDFINFKSKQDINDYVSILDNNYPYLTGGVVSKHSFDVGYGINIDIKVKISNQPGFHLGIWLTNNNKVVPGWKSYMTPNGIPYNEIDIMEGNTGGSDWSNGYFKWNPPILPIGTYAKIHDIKFNLNETFNGWHIFSFNFDPESKIASWYHNNNNTSIFKLDKYMDTTKIGPMYIWLTLLASKWSTFEGLIVSGETCFDWINITRTQSSLDNLKLTSNNSLSNISKFIPNYWLQKIVISNNNLIIEQKSMNFISEIKRSCDVIYGAKICFPNNYDLNNGCKPINLNNIIFNLYDCILTCRILNFCGAYLYNQNNKSCILYPNLCISIGNNNFINYSLINITNNLTNELLIREYNAYGNIDPLNIINPNNTLYYITGWCGINRPVYYSYI